MMRFAEADDLAVRLGRTFDATQTAQVEALLDDATTALRQIVGQDVSAGTTTFTAKLGRGEQWITLPQLPVRSVDAVTVGGLATAEFEIVDQQLHLARGWYDTGGWYGSPVDVEVTYTHGLTTVPAELKRWAIVIASQLLALAETHGALAPAGITNEAETMGSYSRSVGYASGVDAGIAQVPDQAASQLRAGFGAGAYVTGTRGDSW